MKKSAEKVSQLLNYEKLSNIHLLELPKLEKKDIPSFINCPKYEKAKGKLDTKMERFNTKVSRLTSEISSMKTNIAEMRKRLIPLKERMESFKNFQNGSVITLNAVVDVNEYNDFVARYNDILGQIRKLSEKHDDSINKLTEAEEEAKEALEELTAEALQAIDEDIPMVINRLEGIACNFADSDEADGLIAAIDVCLIALRIYAMFDDLIDDNGARKECKEGIAKINQIFSNLCAKDSTQNYIVDVYRRNLDLMQTNAGICQQIVEVLGSVDQKQLDTLSQSINAVLAEQFNTTFDYSKVIEQVELDQIVEKINDTIVSLKSNIDKAKAYQAVETPAVELGKAGVNADQQAKSLRASMQTNVDALDGQNHIVVQIIDEAVIDDFYQKDLRVVATALRKHIVDTIGEANFEGVLKGGDDCFSLKKAQDVIKNANLTRLQVVLDKIPPYIKDLTDKITEAEADIRKANETLKENTRKAEEAHKQNADTLNANISGDYIFTCVPMFGLIYAFIILDRVKEFESAFRKNQVYRDLGNALLEKNKKMITVIMIIGAILGGMMVFFVLNLGDSIAVKAGVPGAILLFYIITILRLTLVRKRLRSYLGSSDGK